MDMVAGAGRGQPVGPPPLDQRVEARDVHRLLDPLAQLGLDACDEIARLAGVAAERRAEGRVGRHPSSRRRPVASGSGTSPNVEKNGAGSQTLSSSSIRSWSGVSGK